MRAWLLVVVVGVGAALVGPRLSGAQNRAATEAFAYQPPEGFVETKSLGAKGVEVGARAWELAGDPTDNAPRPLVVVHHTNVVMPVDEAALGRMVAEMPKAFEDAGCTWVHRRHETRVRPDGARVGLIEGDCDRALDLLSAGLPGVTVRSRRMQLVFPENTGTSVATISYPTEQAARWEPAFEATIAEARGVATRVPAPPLWKHVAWGSAAALLAALVAAVVRRRGKS